MLLESLYVLFHLFGILLLLVGAGLVNDRPVFPALRDALRQPFERKTGFPWFAFSKERTAAWVGLLVCLFFGAGIVIPEKPNGTRDSVVAAVRAFQNAEGLQVDGIVGPETRRALYQ